jgi:hypothetical protein
MAPEACAQQGPREYWMRQGRNPANLGGTSDQKFQAEFGVCQEATGGVKGYPISPLASGE